MRGHESVINGLYYFVIETFYANINMKIKNIVFLYRK